MKKMKLCLAVLGLTFAMIACGGSKNDNGNATTGDSAVTEQGTEATTEGTESSEAKAKDTTPVERAAVDLGLPSGTKWANMNVGANRPDEVGDYYCWGEVTTKDSIEISNYKYYDKNRKLTKYCTMADKGTVDNKTVLDAEDDAATVVWGAEWKMPSSEQMEELCKTCEWTWGKENGQTGFTVKGTNGNTIFLPAGGQKYTTGFGHLNESACYFTSSLHEKYPLHGDCICLKENTNMKYFSMGHFGRSDALNIRPVSAK